MAGLITLALLSAANVQAHARNEPHTIRTGHSGVRRDVSLSYR
jgi:hypothetical protein